jgi:hypothetical protein
MSDKLFQFRASRRSNKIYHIVEITSPTNDRALCGTTAPTATFPVASTPITSSRPICPRCLNQTWYYNYRDSRPFNKDQCGKNDIGVNKNIGIITTPQPVVPIIQAVEDVPIETWSRLAKIKETLRNLSAKMRKEAFIRFLFWILSFLWIARRFP